MPVPFIDLARQHRDIRGDILARISAAIDGSAFILGADVAAFEREFAEYCGGREGVAVNSGTSALHMALLALGVGPGDEVITSPHTFVATVEAILYTGATPVFVDIDDVTYTMDPALLAGTITPRTKAVVPVHIYGQPADMDAIREAAPGVAIVEDACQAHGAMYKGRRVGSLGDAGCFSFYPSKNLGACGEGGMVVTTNPGTAATIRALRDHGQTDRARHDLLGFNCRMSGFQGAALRVKLAHLDRWNQQRRAAAAEYTRLLAKADLRLPREVRGNTHVFHLYVVQSELRDQLRAFMAERGIGTGVHYPKPVHLQGGYGHLGYGRGSFPAAERLGGRVLSLPMFPGITQSEIEEVADAVIAFSPSRCGAA